MRNKKNISILETRSNKSTGFFIDSLSEVKKLGLIFFFLLPHFVLSGSNLRDKEKQQIQQYKISNVNTTTVKNILIDAFLNSKQNPKGILEKTITQAEDIKYLNNSELASLNNLVIAQSYFHLLDTTKGSYFLELAFSKSKENSSVELNVLAELLEINRLKQKGDLKSALINLERCIQDNYTYLQHENLRFTLFYIYLELLENQGKFKKGLSLFEEAEFFKFENYPLSYQKKLEVKQAWLFSQDDQYTESIKIIGNLNLSDSRDIEYLHSYLKLNLKYNRHEKLTADLLSLLEDSLSKNSFVPFSILSQPDLHQNLSVEFLASFEKAYKLIKPFKLIAIESEIANTLALLYTNLSDYAAALTYAEKHKELYQQVLQQKRSTMAKQIELQLLLDEKALTLNLLKAIYSKSNQNLNTAKRNNWLLGIFTLFLLITSMLVFGYTRKNKKLQLILEKQKQQLKTELKTKDKLLSIIGHDLKSPIKNLMGTIELAEQKLLTKEELSEILQNLKSKNVLVTETLESLTKWGSILLNQKNNLTSTEVNINATFEKIIDIYQPLIISKNIRIEKRIDPDLNVFLQEDLAFFCLRNLISNAIKFSYPNGTIIFTASNTSDFLSIKVTDNGVGIDLDKLETIFSKESFYTSLGTNNEKGTGLGLKLIKEFTNRYQWIFNIKPLDKGTEAELLIPNSTRK
ncbi:MAG: sensor histidine kinase [Luteibaculaceae bacterium]